MTKQGTKSPFYKKLKSKCKNCTENSTKVYLRNITRLFNLSNDKVKELPVTGGWLKKKELFEAYNKIPVNKRRHLSIAAVKAVQALDLEDDAVGKKWKLAMLEDANKYQAHRQKNQKSETEEKLWPKGGYLAIKKASSELLKRIKHFIKDKPTLANLYRYQMYVALKLYSELSLIHISEPTRPY